jgi:hypothetical protein
VFGRKAAQLGVDVATAGLRALVFGQDPGRLALFAVLEQDDTP